MTDFTDLTVSSLAIGSQDIPAPTSQALTDDGAITIKNGVVTLNKGAAIGATLANPTATTDDYKRLTIVSLTAWAHTITCTGGFGHGGGGEDVATLGGAIGDSITLIAYGGYWYVAGKNNATLT